MKRLALVLVAVACSVQSDMKSYDAPSADEFRYVSSMLAARCGSLDCHGQAGRALRLYGKFGLRLDAHDVPGREQDTQAEHDANYASVLALEPEVMASVVHDGGRDPERLTLIRKARDLEHHKGANALDADGYQCLTSWLEGAVDKKACFQSSSLQAPPGFSGSGGSGGTNTGGTGGSVGGSGGSVSGGTGGTGGTSLGGTGGTSLGGFGGTSVTGGTGGTVASGGAAGAGGVVCGTFEFWPCTNDPSCAPIAPSPADHDQYAHDECLSCHSPGGAAGPGHEFLFGGVVWFWGGNKGAPHTEVGVRWGSVFYYTCTDQRGFYFVPAAGNPSPDWTQVESRMRTAIGEKIMPSDKEHKPTCNESDCHGDPQHQLWAP